MLGLIPRNDIGYGLDFRYQPAVFANNLPIKEYYRWFPFSENSARSIEGYDLLLIEEHDIWEIDTRLIQNKWLIDNGTGRKGDCIYTLEAIPRESMRLLRITHPDYRTRYRDGVASIYYLNGVREILPR